MPKATKPRATKPKATKPKATRHRFVSVTAERWAKACLLISEGHHKTLAFRATGISKPMLYRYLQFAAAEAERRQAGGTRPSRKLTGAMARATLNRLAAWHRRA